jgi:hypothetical protein
MVARFMNAFTTKLAKWILVLVGASVVYYAYQNSVESNVLEENLLENTPTPVQQALANPSAIPTTDIEKITDNATTYTPIPTVSVEPPATDPAPVPTREVLEMNPSMIQFCKDFNDVLEKSVSQGYGDSLEGPLYYLDNNPRLYNYINQAFKVWGEGTPIDWSKCFGEKLVIIEGNKPFNMGGAVTLEMLQTIKGQVVITTLTGDYKLQTALRYTDSYNGMENAYRAGVLSLVLNNSISITDPENLPEYPNLEGKIERWDPFDYGVVGAEKIILPAQTNRFMFIPDGITYSEAIGVLESDTPFEGLNKLAVYSSPVIISVESFKR